MGSPTWNAANRDKQKAYQRAFYERNKQKRIAEVAKRRKETKAWVDSEKALFRCLLCPENDVVALDFHHLDPKKKEISIARAVTMGWSRTRIMREMEKCKIICSNCHRKLTAGKIALLA